MSLLVIQLPARPRTAARAGSAEPVAALRPPAEWAYVLSADERSVDSSGRAPLALLPAATRVLAVLAEADCAWHRITVPKAPPARLRAALLGVMEEALLDDEEHLHLALGAGTAPGQPGWVAVMHKPWLQTLLTALESQGLGVEAVLPFSRPVPDGAPWRGHFCQAEGLLPGTAVTQTLADLAAGNAAEQTSDLALAPAPGAAVDLNPPGAAVDLNPPGAAVDLSPPGAAADLSPRLLLSRADGLVSLRLNGSLARALLPPAEQAVRWTSTPAAAAAAEAWLGAPLPLLSEAEHLLEAAAGDDNLRQFDLAARHRGTRALRDGWRQLLSPAWRPARWGVAALVAVQVLGLNAYAWQEGPALAEQRAAMTQRLRDTHPGVRAVLDAPRQMQRETERLRAAAGRPGDNDLEALLAAAAAAWPEAQGPVQALRFEAGQLSLTVPGWAEDELAAFVQRLQAGGWQVERVDERVTLGRAATGAPS